MRWSSPPRERRGGTAPPASSGGALFWSASPQLLRHLLEHAAFVGRETLDSALGNFVEDAIELFGLRFPSARRWRERNGSLGHDRFALRDDIVDFIAALTPRKIAWDRARWLVGVGQIGDALPHLVHPGGRGH